MEIQTRGGYDEVAWQKSLLKDTGYTPQRLRFELLFCKPLDPGTRKVATIMLHQYEGLSDELVYDEVLKLDKRTRTNYHNILGAFDEEFRKPAPDPLPFQVVMNSFLHHTMPATPTDRVTPYLQECKRYITDGKNKFTPAFEATLKKALNAFAEARPLDGGAYSALNVARVQSTPARLNVEY